MFRGSSAESPKGAAGVGAWLPEHHYFIKISRPATYVSLISHSSGSFLARSFLSPGRAGPGRAAHIFQKQQPGRISCRRAANLPKVGRCSSIS